MEINWNTIEVLGAIAAGYGLIYLIQATVKRFIHRVEGGEFLTHKEFITYKTDLAEARAKLDLLVTQKEFLAYQVERQSRLKEVKDELNESIKEIKSACAVKQASCSSCIQEIKSNQQVLRQQLPGIYLHREDFKDWKTSWEEWLSRIEDKVDKVLLREVEEKK
jgi:hypothetical protein